MNPSKAPEKGDSPQSSKSKFFIILAMGLVAIVMVAIASVFSTSLVFTNARDAQAAQQVSGMVNAVTLYELQYGRLPKIGGGTVPTEAPLIDILTGIDRVKNPKEIAFLEGRQAKPAKGTRPARAGMIVLGSGSQSLVDPWGNHFMVRVDADGDGFIDDPGGGKPIPAKVICWSYGPPPDKKDYRSALTTPPARWIKSW